MIRKLGLPATGETAHFETAVGRVPEQPIYEAVIRVLGRGARRAVAGRRRRVGRRVGRVDEELDRRFGFDRVSDEAAARPHGTGGAEPGGGLPEKAARGAARVMRLHSGACNSNLTILPPAAGARPSAAAACAVALASAPKCWTLSYRTLNPQANFWALRRFLTAAHAA